MVQPTDLLVAVDEQRCGMPGNVRAQRHSPRRRSEGNRDWPILLLEAAPNARALASVFGASFLTSGWQHQGMRLKVR